MKTLVLLELTLLLGIVFAVVSGAVFSRLIPWVLAITEHWAPERRHRLLLLFSLSPLTLSIASVVAVLMPGLMALVWPALDHCLTHDDHHLHLCFVHLPVHSAGFWALVALGLVMTWLAWTTCTGLFEMTRASRLVSNLHRLGAWDARLEAHVLTTDRPVCLLSGALTPTVLVSKGFLASMTESELNIALHHERTHARRRDILWRLVARVATVFIWSKPREQLLGTFDLAAERSCDEAAASQVGSRLRVAETILKVERLLHVPAQLAPAVASFGGESVPARVEALLKPAMRAGNILPWISSFAVLLLLIVTVNHPIHHFAESFIELLAH